MRIELLAGMMNVVRFPTERRARPTLDLLRAIAPDVREVLNLADAFGIEAPVHDLRDRVDAETAEHIVNQVPAQGLAREAMLRELEAPVIEAPWQPVVTRTMPCWRRQRRSRFCCGRRRRDTSGATSFASRRRR